MCLCETECQGEGIAPFGGNHGLHPLEDRSLFFSVLVTFLVTMLSLFWTLLVTFFAYALLPSPFCRRMKIALQAYFLSFVEFYFASRGEVVSKENLNRVCFSGYLRCSFPWPSA